MLIFDWSSDFEDWLGTLADQRARARVLKRLQMAEAGNFGDCDPVGEGVSEMRVHIGPGYRVYFTRIDSSGYAVLTGGDKSSQRKDIERAKEMARDLGRNKQ
jgi:putative addiction module killer protein